MNGHAAPDPSVPLLVTADVTLPMLQYNNIINTIVLQYVCMLLQYHTKYASYLPTYK